MGLPKPFFRGLGVLYSPGPGVGSPIHPSSGGSAMVYFVPVLLKVAKGNYSYAPGPGVVTGAVHL